METKWLMLFAIAAFTGLFASIGISEYGKSQCQIEGIKAGMTAESIVKTCGASR